MKRVVFTLQYKVDEEGVAALRTMAEAISEVTDIVSLLISSVQSDANSRSDTLGPHKASLDRALEEIKESIVQASQPVSEVSESLNDVADAYEEVIENDRIKYFGNQSRTDSKGITSTNGIHASPSGKEFNNSGNNSSISYSSVSECSNYNELGNYLQSRYGLTLDESVKSLDYNSVKSSLTGIESVISEFPEVGNSLFEATTSTAGIMSCSGSRITFNPNYYSDSGTLEKVCTQQSSLGYWPRNSSPVSIGVHEAAHGVEWAIIQANRDYSTVKQRVDAWNNCTEAKKIVKEAVQNISKTPYAKDKNILDIIKGISGYALSSRSETMAEAFADVYSNGENANPLSIEIKRVTEKLLSRYKGAV